jgi:hypothetical protein
MPIHERDSWRLQYFENVECPADVHIPTDDADGYRWNPQHRWIYNKLLVAESQGLACAPHGIAPTSFPVFSKPIYNLFGMGVGSRLMRSRAEYEQHETPGHLWMTNLAGDHVSTDLAVIDGAVHWSRHAHGTAGLAGTFDHWTIEAQGREDLDAYLRRWIAGNLPGYVGMLNVETIGGRIIEAHLRFSDQWPDLYGTGWLDAVVGLYSTRIWRFDDHARRTGYSVVLFGPHGRAYRRPPWVLQRRLLQTESISSLQITFEEEDPAGCHAMPPGGFRLAVINCDELAAGLRVRRELGRYFDLESVTGGQAARVGPA